MTDNTCDAAFETVAEHGANYLSAAILPGRPSPTFQTTVAAWSAAWAASRLPRQRDRYAAARVLSARAATTHSGGTDDGEPTSDPQHRGPPGGARHPVRGGRGRAVAAPGTRAWFLVPERPSRSPLRHPDLPTGANERLPTSSATLNQEWPFVGAENFRKGFASGAMIAGRAHPGGRSDRDRYRHGVGLAAKIALRTTGRWSAIILAGMVFVWALPPVVNGSVWKFLFAEDGLINTLVLLTPLRADPIPFLYDATWALVSVALVTTWAVIPFNALVFRAALLGINPEIFEAAALDGATRWQEIRHIMIPAAKPTALVLLVLTIVYPAAATSST